MSFVQGGWRTIGFLGAMIGAVVSSAEPSPPAKSVPIQKFEERLSAQEYESRFAAAAASLKAAEKLAQGGQPALGLNIIEVHDKSPAQKLGIRLGDVATRINGTNLWSTTAFRMESGRTLDLYSTSAKKMKTLKLPDGKIGITTSSYWYPDVVYLRSKAKNAKWDSEAFVGINTASTDPDLAETAWHRAIAKGFRPDLHSAAAGVEIALSHNDSKSASDFCNILASADDPQSLIINPILLYRAALAHGHLDGLLQIIQKHPDVFETTAAEIQSLIDIKAKQQKNEGDGPFLEAMAESFLRDDLINRLMGHWHNDVTDSLPRLQRRETVLLNSIQLHYDGLIVSPPEPTPNLDISMNIKLQHEGAGSDPFWFDVSLIDNSSPEYGFEDVPSGEALLKFSLSRHNQAAGVPEKTIGSGRKVEEFLVHLNYSQVEKPLVYFDPSLKLDNGSTVKIRLLKIGGTGELYVNGRRMIRVPIDTSIKDLALMVKVMGTRIAIQDFLFDELIEDETGNRSRK